MSTSPNIAASMLGYFQNLNILKMTFNRSNQMLLGKSSKQINTEKSILVFQAGLSSQPPWRNRLARSAVNRKVGGSSPPGGVPF